jgi:mannitol-specific phosphotransferase system IIBC component
VGVNDRERTDAFGIKLSGSFLVKNEAFIAWLVIVMTAFFISSSKIVIDDNLSTFL